MRLGRSRRCGSATIAPGSPGCWPPSRRWRPGRGWRPASSQYVFAGRAPAGASGGAGGPASAAGLEYTFLDFLVLLMAVGKLVLPTPRTYSCDVATATASASAEAIRSCRIPDSPRP